jgi:hypothetical protein
MHIMYFPWMHPEGDPHAAAAGVSFLDPGIGGGHQAECFWVPEGLPLDRQQAMRYVQEALSFGERFQDHKELEYLRAAGLEDFFTGTSSSLSDELERRIRDQDGETEELERRKRGQMVLLLSWMWEEKLLETRSGEREYQAMMSELRENLGIEDSETEDQLGLGDLSGSLGTQDPSRWSGLMPWFLLFLPPDGVLYIRDRGIQEELRENGMQTAELSEDSQYGELKRFIRERGVRARLGLGPGWRLALKSRSDPDMPWLDREYTLLLGEG